MLASERFVGRSAELLLLGSALSSLRDAGSLLVLVSGEPGIGKSTLCEVFSQQARERGARVATGSAWEWGDAPPFWPWLQIARELSLLSPADPPGPLSAWQAGPRAEDEPSASARFELFDALVERLRHEAEKAPLVLLFEDLHAADVPSLLLLRFALQQLRSAPVLLLATRRTVETQPLPAALLLLSELSRRALPIELAGLTQAELAGITTDALTDPALAELHARTAGNPLLVKALLAAAPGALPQKARAAIEQRLSGLDLAARQLLEEAAVLGQELSLGLLAKVAARPLPELLEPLRVLSQERILLEGESEGSLRFCHGLFREAVYGQLDPARRLRLHRAAGLALEQLGDVESHLPALARHFLAVTPEVDKAVQYAAAAGDQAQRALGFEAAIEHYRTALAALASLPSAGTAAVSLWTRLGEAQAASGATEAARDSYRAARRVVEVRPRADEKSAEREPTAATAAADDEAWLTRAALGLARLPGFGALDEEAVQWLSQRLAVTAAASPRVRLLGALTARSWMLQAGVARSEALAAQALQLARETGDTRLYAEALAESSVMSWVADGGAELHRQRAAELLTRAEQLGDGSLLAEAQRWRFSLAMVHGDVADAQLALAALSQLADRLGRPQLRVQVLIRRFMLACLAGRFQEAALIPAELAVAARRAGDPQLEFMLASLTLQRERAFAGPGLAAATEQLRHAAGMYMHPDVTAALVMWSHAQLGQHERARPQLPVLIDGVERLPWIGKPIVLAACSWVAYLLADAGQAARLLPLLAPFRALTLTSAAIELHGNGSFYLGLAAATIGDLPGAQAALERAMIEHTRLGAGPYLARAQNALGWLLASSAPERSAQLLRAAREYAAELGGLWLGDPPASSPPARAPVNAEPHATHGLFAREGDSYALALGESSLRVVRIREGKGLAYLEQLLRNPGEELHVLSLSSAAIDQDGAGPALDPQAKLAYRARIEALREQLGEAEQLGDLARASRAGEELDALANELARATGLGGRDRTSGTAERARASVTLAIRRAVKAIQALHPELGAHLATAVQTGTFCSYRPEPRARVHWRFEP